MLVQPNNVTDARLTQVCRMCGDYALTDAGWNAKAAKAAKKYRSFFAVFAAFAFDRDVPIRTYLADEGAAPASAARRR